MTDVSSLVRMMRVGELARVELLDRIQADHHAEDCLTTRGGKTCSCGLREAAAEVGAPVWEKVSDEVERLCVVNGWLYRTRSYRAKGYPDVREVVAESTAFVPDPRWSS